MLEKIYDLWEHVLWADDRLMVAFVSGQSPIGALREYAHIIGTEETWLARLQRRTPQAAVWPADAPPEAVTSLVETTHAAYREYLAGLREADMTTDVTYTNSAGRTFTNTVCDILLHVALHGQHHRGRVNLMLRQAGQTPVPSDYIAFIRGEPAATGSPDGPGSAR